LQVNQSNMNRLILVGNGFDLAHGLKTSYNDFILSYVSSCLTEANDKRVFKDDAMTISTGQGFYDLPRTRWKSIEELVMDVYKTSGLDALFTADTLHFGSYAIRNIFSASFRFPFVKKLIVTCSDCNWVDIENLYYKSIISNNKGSGDVNELNLAMKHIISKLEEYLSSLPKIEPSIEYTDIFRSRIREQEFVMPNISQHSKLEKTLVLSFNYTNNIEGYSKLLNIANPNPHDLNFIHGRLQDPENPIIFGFGDELDKDYSVLEMHETKGLLDYLKSFWYNRTTNYHNLIRFIESDYFQVFILGHSCGLSDRTMLNMIFEHDNCKSIKIFYYEDEAGKTNYNELTQEISRNFIDKRSMRRKIVPFPLCAPMSQVGSKG